MAPKGGKIVDITGIVARLGSATRYAISGVTPSAWMSPGQPLTPAVPAGTQARTFDYPVGFNQQTRPRAHSAVTFHTLRELSRSCDILRLVIETRKDQIEALDWQIRPRADGKSASTDSRIVDIQAFFMSPDRRSDWNAWLRALLEDLFVLDAVAIEKRRDRTGRLHSLRLLNAATIALKIDENGDTPTAPDIAYQQIVKGVPAVDFSTDELIYAMRNPRTDSPYGFGPVEQIIATVNVALRRTASQLSYYTDGNLNAGVFWLPPDWSPDQVKAFNDWWNSLHSGNQAEKSQAKFVPGAKDSFQQIVQPPLKDEFDEWLARVICYAFSIAPTPFIKQMNRATADNAHDAALEEGLAPIQRWLKCQLDRIITEEFDAPDLEFVWVDDREVDPQTAASVQDIKLRNGSLLIDEARAQDGLDPLPDGLGNTPGVVTATGFVPLPRPDLVDAQQDAQLAGQQAAKETALSPPGPSDALDETDQPEEEGKAAKALAKKYSNPLDTPAARTASTAIHKRVHAVLNRAGHHVAAQIRGIGVLGKAEDDDDDKRATAKAKADSITGQLNLFDLADTKAISTDLSPVAEDSAITALDGTGVAIDTAMFGQVNRQSVEWAGTHAAELVTKITDSTREMLRATIQDGFADKDLDIHGIADEIAKSYAFSDQRALLIADTETAFAHGQGALTGYRAARDLGIKIKKQWLDDPLACPICVGNAEDGPIDIEDQFSSGNLTTPAHPRCLPANSLISPCGDVSGATRRWFKGDMVVICTSGDHKLTLTPNHPVLTDHGWVAAGLLKEGDHVISGSLMKRTPISDVHDENVPTRIEEITQAFVESGGVTPTEVITAAPHFHGDGKGSDVAIVWTKRQLRNVADSALVEHGSETNLVKTDVQLLPRNCLCPAHTLAFGVNTTTGSDVRSGSYDFAFIQRASHITEDTSGLVISDVDTRLNKNAADSRSGNSVERGDLVFRLSGDITTDDLVRWQVNPSRHAVVAVSSFPFEGYVYNIETQSGFYIADGLVVHNCSCTTISVIEDD